MVIGIISAVVLPQLPLFWKKLYLAVAAIPVLFFLHYMIVTPGWTPDQSGRMRPPWNKVVFSLIAAAIISGLTLFLFQ